MTMKLFFAVMALGTLLSTYASVGTVDPSGAYLGAPGRESSPEIKVSLRDGSTTW
jgi:hypothetical protein